MGEYSQLIYEVPEPGIARIWLNRADIRNAQDTAFLIELNAAFDEALADDAVKVVVLAAKGPHFSAGHHLGERGSQHALDGRTRISGWKSDDWSGVEAYYCREKEVYEGYCRRWRDLAKPTIAAVQGKVIAGGLMLMWPMDLVIASDDATFQDNTMFMGIPGVEYFAHVWELGIRKAKEFLLTGAPIDAQEALRAGMVNRVVPRAELEEAALAFARQVADKPALALKLGKESINAAFAATGFDNVQRGAFAAHHLAHTHWRLTAQGSYLDPAFAAAYKSRAKGGQ